jgi:dynein heavy chain, axonemal
LIINPKSLTLSQLYGAFDPMTHEWSDGVLPKCYRQMALSNSTHRYQIAVIIDLFFKKHA